MAADGQIQISGPTAEKQIANRAADKIHPSGSGRGNGTQGFQDLARKEIPHPGASDKLLLFSHGSTIANPSEKILQKPGRP
jgi:hypothetical protein